jgi:hypothetical protein
MSDMTVAKTILEQLGGNAFVRMTGARNLIGSSDALSFKLPGNGFTKNKANVVKITLTPADTYTVTFSKFRAMKLTPVSEFTDIYNDALVDLFERETGLATRMPRIIFT